MWIYLSKAKKDYKDTCKMLQQTSSLVPFQLSFTCKSQTIQTEVLKGTADVLGYVFSSLYDLLYFTLTVCVPTLCHFPQESPNKQGWVFRPLAGRSFCSQLASVTSSMKGVSRVYSLVLLYVDAFLYKYLLKSRSSWLTSRPQSSGIAFQPE